jgi:plastocyanin
MHQSSRRTIAGALLLVALLLLVPLAGQVRATGPAAARANGAESVKITVGSAFAFSPSSFEVTPGDQVTISVEQLDGVEHTFALSPIANFSFDTSNSSQDLLTFFAAHPPLVYFHINGSTAGAIQTATFTAPPLGVYEYVCTIAGHFQAGMWGKMGSGVAVGPPPGPSVPVALYIITGVIVALVVLAIVLGFIVGKREGARHEMPPERLGYPEPGAPPLPGGRSPPDH